MQKTTVMMTMKTLNELTEHLKERTICPPSGWFRWMHHSYMYAEYYMNKALVKELDWSDLITPWPDLPHEVLSRTSSAKLDEEDALSMLIPQAERHAWLLGFGSNLELLDKLWTELSPEARAMVFAGVSEKIGGILPGFKIEHQAKELVRWLLEKAQCDLPVAFDGTTAAQFCCNFSRYGFQSTGESPKALLYFVLNTAAEWGKQKVHLFKEVFGRRLMNSNLELYGFQSTSDAIYLCLEAAVRKMDCESARLYMIFGAYPELHYILWMDRSYTVSYSIAELARSNPRMLKTLINGGSYPTGTFINSEMSAYRQGVHGSKRSIQVMIENVFKTQFKDEEVDWVERQIGELMPLVNTVKPPGLPKAGEPKCREFKKLLDIFLEAGDLDGLHKIESLGLPIELSAWDILIAIHAGAWDCLSYTLDRLNYPQQEILRRIKQRYPDFVNE